MAAPIDPNNLAYIIMLYEGVGNLFPWNAFITASSYYAQRFCGTAFETTFENYFSITYTLSQTIGLALSIVYQERFTLQQRIVIPLLLYSLVFAVTTCLVAVENIDPSLLFGLTLISACMCGLFGAALSGGLFSLAAMLPPAYTGAIMSGQGLAGLTVAVSALLTSLATPAVDDCNDDSQDDGEECTQSISYSALAYFMIATFILLTCSMAYFYLKKMSFTKYYVDRALGDPLSDVQNPLMQGLDENSQNGGVVFFNDEKEKLTKTESEFDHTKSSKLSMRETMSRAVKVYKIVAIPSFSVFFVFTVTIAIFPSLTVLVESTQKCSSSDRFYNDLFVPFLFLMFNLFDLFGRLAAGSTKCWFTAKNIWMASVARLIFWPMFLFLNVSNSQIPTLFESDAFPIIFMALMAFTNGYVASNAMMMGASIVNPEDSGMAGTIMIFSLTVGLFMGACCSFIIVLISQGHL